MPELLCSGSLVGPPPHFFGGIQAADQLPSSGDVPSPAWPTPAVLTLLRRCLDVGVPVCAGAVVDFVQAIAQLH